MCMGLTAALSSDSSGSSLDTLSQEALMPVRSILGDDSQSAASESLTRASILTMGIFDDTSAAQ